MNTEFLKFRLATRGDMLFLKKLNMSLYIMSLAAISKQLTDGGRCRGNCCFRIRFPYYTSNILKMEAANSSETSTRCHIPDKSNLHQQRFQRLKYRNNVHVIFPHKNDSKHNTKSWSTINYYSSLKMLSQPVR
jgi:hypothetical protein